MIKKVTKDEIGSEDIDDIEVDYGEVLLYRTALYGFKTAILIATAYNYEVSSVQMIIDKIADDMFDWKKDIWDKYKDLLMLTTGGDVQIEDAAKNAMINLIDSYIEASDFIRQENDDQSNDLLSIDSASDSQLIDENKFKQYLLEVRRSLTEGVILSADTTQEIWSFTNDDELNIYLTIDRQANGIFESGTYHDNSYYSYDFGEVDEFSTDKNTVVIKIHNSWGNEIQLWNTNTYTPGMPIDNLNEMLDSYDISKNGRDIFNWTADFAKDPNGDIELPENSPLFKHIQTY
ncbi:hypothetical protein MHK_006433 [Candidatus Magnetomorum sp. HK-1]|nr:hypothetical protein MHK_006433 [Candidatus Magnetomorum sp. HK-1]